MALVGRKTRLSAVASIGIRQPELKPGPTVINKGIALLTRMDQVAGDLSYVFPYGVQDVSHDVGAVQFDELSRPLSLPILQPTAATLQKVSFSFVIAQNKDGISKPINEDIRLIQSFAAEDNSVIFVNAHEMLTSSVGSWKISSVSIQIERVNELGEAVLARGNMSCTESSDQLERFLTLPKFTYKVNKGGKVGKDTSPSPSDEPATLVYKFFSRTKEGIQNAANQSDLARLQKLATQYGEQTIREILDGISGGRTVNEVFTAVNGIIEAKKRAGEIK